MNDQTPRKGDRAIIVGLAQSITANGKIVLVLSDPRFGEWKSMFGSSGKELINDIDLASYADDPTSVVPTRCLIRIPPPSESQTLFADESVERGVTV